jgi:polysaccharide biosynthesis protein PslH
MRIVFLVSRVPWPLEKGDKLRVFHLIRELSQRHEILLFCLTDQSIDPLAESKLREFCSEVHIHRLSKVGIAWRLFKGLFNTLPFQVSYFTSKKAIQAFEKFIDKNVPQHIFCQLIRTAEYAKRYTLIPKSIDYMDALSNGMKRMADQASWPISTIMSVEQKRLEHYETKVQSHFDRRFVISEQDKQQLSSVQNLEVVANGVDPIFLTINQAREKQYDFLFTGNMSYRPNVESARFLVSEILPIVWKTHPNTKLCLAGASPSAVIRSLESEKVIVTGWVDDISLIYQSSLIFVAPMLINSGLQNKLLEAMASQLPCVTSQLANNALTASPGDEVLIGSTAQEYADQITRLLDDEQLRIKIGEAGQRFVKRTFSWSKSTNLIEKSIMLL